MLLTSFPYILQYKPNEAIVLMNQVGWKPCAYGNFVKFGGGVVLHHKGNVGKHLICSYEFKFDGYYIFSFSKSWPWISIVHYRGCHMICNIVALEFDKFFHASYNLYIMQWTNFIPSNLRTIILIFILGYNYVFNVFTFICHKFCIFMHITLLYMPFCVLFVFCWWIICCCV